MDVLLKQQQFCLLCSGMLDLDQIPENDHQLSLA